MRPSTRAIVAIAGICAVVFGRAIPTRADFVTVGPLAFDVPKSTATISPPNGQLTSSGNPQLMFAVADLGPAQLQVPRFDPTLGTLVVVILELRTDPVPFLSDIQVISFPPPGLFVRYATSILLTGPSGALLGASGSTSVELPQVGAFYTGIAILATGDTGLATETLTAPSDLATFLGPGTLNLDASKQIVAMPSPATWVHTRITDPGDFSGALTVRYEFRAVPEPRAIWLAGSGVLMVAAYKRRRGVSRVYHGAHPGRSRDGTVPSGMSPRARKASVLPD